VNERADKLKRTTAKQVEDHKLQIANRDKIIASIENQSEQTLNDFQKLNKELREINAEREEDSNANALIIKQISTMKSVIEDFKDREKDKE